MNVRAQAAGPLGSVGLKRRVSPRAQFNLIFYREQPPPLRLLHEVELQTLTFLSGCGIDLEIFELIPLYFFEFKRDFICPRDLRYGLPGMLAPEENAGINNGASLSRIEDHDRVDLHFRDLREIINERRETEEHFLERIHVLRRASPPSRQ